MNLKLIPEKKKSALYCLQVKEWSWRNRRGLSLVVCSVREKISSNCVDWWIWTWFVFKHIRNVNSPWFSLQGVFDNGPFQSRFWSKCSLISGNLLHEYKFKISFFYKVQSGSYQQTSISPYWLDSRLVDSWLRATFQSLPKGFTYCTPSTPHWDCLHSVFNKA